MPWYCCFLPKGVQIKKIRGASVQSLVPKKMGHVGGLGNGDQQSLGATASDVLFEACVDRVEQHICIERVAEVSIVERSNMGTWECGSVDHSLYVGEWHDHPCPGWAGFGTVAGAEVPVRSG